MKNRSLFDSYNNALQGVIHALRNERNFKIHFSAAIIVLLVSIVIKVNVVEFLILCITVSAVIVAELFNTAIEAVVDLYCGEKRHPLAKVAKDTAAGAVFITAVNACIVGYLLFYKKIMESGLSSASFKIIRETPYYITLVCIVIVIMLTIIIKTYTKAENFFRGGMPSAHSALAFALATCISFLTKNAMAVSLSYFLAFLVAQSRIEGKIHSFLQVILGGTLGTLVTIMIFQWFGAY